MFLLMTIYIAYIIFMASSLGIIYVYLLYPVIIGCVSFFCPAPLLNIYKKETEIPYVTILCSVYNEELILPQKLKNFHSIKYPSDKLQIVFISDCSTDNTDNILLDASKDNNQISFRRMEKRGGKVRALNTVIKDLSDDIIIVTDANTIFEPDTVLELVKYFKTPQVGFVSGDLIYVEKERGVAAEGESLYWKYETLLKHIENRGMGILMGAGALMAFRRELFEPVPEETADDSYIPLIIRSKGYRTVFVESAKGYEHVSMTIKEETQRRIRMVGQDTRVFFYILGRPATRKILFLFQLVSHKFLRWNVIHFILLAFISSTYLALNGVLIMLYILETIFYILAIIGLILEYKKKGIFFIFSFPAYFISAHLAAGIGFWQGILGRTQSVWEKAPSTRKY